MKRKLLKIGLIILLFFLVKEIILISISNHDIKESINAYYNNDTSFNYKSDFIIKIPKINLEGIIKKADDDFKNLNDSLVYYKYNNYKEKIIVFGHSGIGYGAYFNRLDELDVNDYVYLYKDKLKITYKVDKIYSIFDSELGILNNDRKGTLLLVTCEKINKNKRRVVELTIKDSKSLEK